MYKEYKVVRVNEGGCSTLLFGGASIPEKKLERELNAQASDGWTVVFQITEHSRFLLFFSRESVLVTFGR
ncbi:MAG: DUF4177 domain-containing protein [Ignavibacteria bacterium]|nr:DUF4177 domain-containing protein [Ignavibacteria bacterium]MBK6759093.1 DUF4177 domain-containing protein [Ignavibacteria bacterium]MBK7578427.1 DUF4177 domain-containing protein [Ignavibacteria bacterium]MBL0321708.1 DUF4177 domain-containing protein [Ignavibacteria bacterium]